MVTTVTGGIWVTSGRGSGFSSILNSEGGIIPNTEVSTRGGLEGAVSVILKLVGDPILMVETSVSAPPRIGGLAGEEGLVLEPEAVPGIPKKEPADKLEGASVGVLGVSESGELKANGEDMTSFFALANKIYIHFYFSFNYISLLV